MTDLVTLEIILFLALVFLVLAFLSLALVLYEHKRTQDLIATQAVKSNIIDDIIT